MTLAKAAPADWAVFFAAATGMPVEYVRRKLRNAALSGKITGDEMNKRPPRLEPGTASPHHLISPGRG